MTDSFTTTQILAALIGLYFLAAGIGVLWDRESFSAVLDDVKAQPALGYLGGALAFVIGGAIVSVHNNWDDFLSGFVSVVGWVCLAEGVLMLACRRQFLDAVSRLSLTPAIVSGFGLVTLIAGLFLLAVTVAS